jgi:hypothetical protein
VIIRSLPGKTFLSCFVAALSLATSQAEAAKNASAGGNATMLRRLSIVKTLDLDFGNMAAGTTSGTVVINPTTSARTTTGGVVQMGGTPQAAQFYTYGGPLQSVVVNRGPLPVLTRVGGGASMNVANLTLNGPTTRLLTAAGLLDLRVGGQLNVSANQMQGSYVGSFQIIVTYF